MTRDPLRQLDADLWVTEAPLRFFGLEIGARMTVLRLADGRLWLHSPVRPSAELLAAVRDLGEVAFLVAPNRLHHLFVGDWQQAFPTASLFVAPGLERKRADLEIAGVIGATDALPWAEEIDEICVEGFPFASEVVFFHRATGTLLLTDLAFNVGPESALLTRLVFWLSGAYGRLSPTLLERMLVRDRTAFRASLERILAWPFGRVVVSHGAVCETGGREALQRSYRWALGPGATKALP